MYVTDTVCVLEAPTFSTWVPKFEQRRRGREEERGRGE